MNQQTSSNEVIATATAFDRGDRTPEEGYVPRPTGLVGGEWGALHLLSTGEYLRRATEAESAESIAEGSAGCTGAIEVDGLTCYVGR